MPTYVNPFAAQTAGATLPGAGNLTDYYLNSTPDAAFWEYLNRKGLSGQGNNVSKYAQGQQNRVYNQFEAHIANDPDLGFWDYLQQQQPDLQGDYMSQAPSQRGDTSGKFLTPRARFVNAY
jgi:hypothetical protein